jgi:hypothetical protein
MYGHARIAMAKDGNEYPYFGNIYSNAFGTKMCGDDKIYRLSFEPAPDLEKDKEEVEYWGWLNEKGELSMVYANYFLFDMCFPNGAEASEGFGDGKRVKLNLLNFQDKY